MYKYRTRCYIPACDLSNNMWTRIALNKKLFQISISVQSSAYLLSLETIPSVMMLPTTKHENQELHNLFHLSQRITRNHVEKMTTPDIRQCI